MDGIKWWELPFPFFAKDLVQIIIIQMDSQTFSLVDGASTPGKAKGKQNNAVRVAWPFGGLFSVAIGWRIRIPWTGPRRHVVVVFITMVIIGTSPKALRIGLWDPFQMAVNFMA